MRLIKILILVIGMPSMAYGANMRYQLDVAIETQSKTLSGIAHIRASENQAMTFFVKNLSNLTVDGKSVTPDKGQLMLTFQADQEIVIRYEASLEDNGLKAAQFVDQDNVFLTGNWYPQPDALMEYALSVTLPKGFIATSEAESVEIQKTEANSTFKFQFKHPLDSLSLAASKNYVFKKEAYKNIAIETYFFKEDAHLAETYIDYTKKYLAMYEEMLTPYPYQRFAIVENILPTGYSMPTYTLLGRAIVHLPFIVETSLGHEILHQWFGNSVFIDYSEGNWAEGITNYLADQHYATLNSKGIAYRKKIMADYNAYVNTNNAMPVSAFQSRNNNAQKAIGYGKAAMIFHAIRKQYGDEAFFTAIREFIHSYSFRIASWHDIQLAFENVTGENLLGYFTQWIINRQDIPHITAEEVELLVVQGKLTLSFTLIQHTAPYFMPLSVTIYTAAGQTQRTIEISSEREKISLQLDELPTKVVIDEDYDLMRQLLPEEISPTLGGIMGNENIIVAMSKEKSELYQPLIKSLGFENITFTAPQEMKLTQLKDHSLIIAGFDTPMGNMLFGKQERPKDGVRVLVYKNPYNEKEMIALLHAKNANEVKAITRKLSHYGKYSLLAFNEGKNTEKAITESINGIPLLTRSPPHALQPDKVATLNDIIPKIIDNRVIYVGEQHDQFAHHINQLTVIKKCHEAGYKIAVGMEMFQVPYQKALNDYMAGEIDERTFLKESQYFNNWGYDYNLYKPIIDYVKSKGIPLIALNIDKHITNKVSKQGIDSLTAEEKQQIPSAMDLSNGTYRHDLYQVFLLHQKRFGHQNFDYFLQTQAIWDETMAQTASQFLTDNPDSKLIVLAGNGHVMYKYGIPNRLSQRKPEPFSVIVQAQAIDKGIADYILLTQKLKGKKAPKLGVMIKEKDNQVIIMGVGDNTPAKKARLQVGDVIIQVAAQKIQTLADLKFALFYTEMGNLVTIQLMRNGKKITIDVTLFEQEQPHHQKKKEKKIDMP